MPVIPRIPMSFTPPADQFAEHLEMAPAGAEVIVTWPVIATPFKVPATQRLDMAEIARANGGLVAFHSLYGFSVGNYHEFLVAGRGEFAAAGYVMGNLEVTFGVATPLMAYLFQRLYRLEVDGPWHTIFTARIFGAATLELAEIAFINGAILHNENFRYLPRFWFMGMDAASASDFYERQPGTVEEEQAAYADIEPLRFFYQAQQRTDHVAACINLYRILEYYAFSLSSDELATLRMDSAVDNEQFRQKARTLLRRNEEKDLAILIKKLITIEDFPLQEAVSHRLIDEPTPRALASGLYKFRNSIVHGKNDPNFYLHSTSVFQDSMIVFNWRFVLQDLAKAALDLYATRFS